MDVLAEYYKRSDESWRNKRKKKEKRKNLFLERKLQNPDARVEETRNSENEGSNGLTIELEKKTNKKKTKLSNARPEKRERDNTIWPQPNLRIGASPFSDINK